MTRTDTSNGALTRSAGVCRNRIGYRYGQRHGRRTKAKRSLGKPWRFAGVPPVASAREFSEGACQAISQRGIGQFDPAKQCLGGCGEGSFEFGDI